jgi:hypothetical protein
MVARKMLSPENNSFPDVYGQAYLAVLTESDQLDGASKRQISQIVKKLSIRPTELDDPSRPVANE